MPQPTADLERQMTPMLKKLAEENGAAVADLEEFWQWIQTLPPQRQRTMENQTARRLSAFYAPTMTFWMADYRELASACWMPIRQGWYHSETNAQGKLTVLDAREMKVVEATANRPLPDELFVLPFKKGAKIDDFTVNPTHSYILDEDEPTTRPARDLGPAPATAPAPSPAPATAPASQPSAADLVREVRASVQWVDAVRSLYLKIDGKFIPVAQAPGEIPVANPDRLEIAFDARRVLLRWDSPQMKIVDDTRLFDGRQVRTHTNKFGRESYSISNDPADGVGRWIPGHINWFRTGPHRLWWLPKG